MTTDTGLRELDLHLSDGRTLHVYDREPRRVRRSTAAEPLTVFWLHGTPNLGAPPEPLFAAADRLGLRWMSFDRPGYGASTPNPGRTLTSVAADLAEVADSFGIGTFAVVGHSGGGAHALACGAALPDRVVAAASMAALAPYGVPELDWFAGMVPSGEASLRAAVRGREARAAHEESGVEYDPEFTEADLATLDGAWSWLMHVVGPALDAGPDGLIDDDLAYVTDWGADPTRTSAPLLLLHGEQDGVVPVAHGRWVEQHCPTASLRTFGEDGHISVLAHAEDALEWLVQEANARSS